MTSYTLSLLLVLFMLVISNARFMFLQKVKADSLSVMPLVAFLISLLIIFAYGIPTQSFLVALLALFVTIWNVRAMLRFFSRVVIDHYEPLFILISSINLLLCIAGIVFVFYFSPRKTDLKKYGVTESVYKFTGNFDDGFREISNPFELNTATLWKFEKEAVVPAKVDGDAEDASVQESAAEIAEDTAGVAEGASEPTEDASLLIEKQTPRKIVLFVPPKTAVKDTYMPFFAKLARDGYTVYTAEFHDKKERLFNSFADARFLRQETFIATRMASQETGSALLRSAKVLLESEYENLIKMAEISAEDFVFLVTEEDLAEILPKVQVQYSELLDGCMDISYARGYSTPGYGPVENTSPFLAYLLGKKKDNTFYMASHIAGELEKPMEACMF